LNNVQNYMQQSRLGLRKALHMVERQGTLSKREEQKEALISAAEKHIAAQGFTHLRARDLAKEIGISLGAIYNLVADMDEVILRVASRTLAKMDAELSLATPDSLALNTQAAIERLQTIAKTYRMFAQHNTHLWHTLFEHRMESHHVLPEWAIMDQMYLFRHILIPLSVLMPHEDEDVRMLMARTLFSAVHGIVALGMDDKLVAVPHERLDAQIDTCVALICRGLIRV
jgi:AcrR family transcriptional regulator